MTTQKLPHIEIVMPVFNEVRTLEPLLNALDAVVARLHGEATVSYLFVNDGSSDGTRELLERYFRARNDIRVVDLVHNFGHGPALSAGLHYFRGDVAVFMDADLQDDPSAILEMYVRWKRGARTVVAERGSRKERGKIFFKAFYFLLHKTTNSIPPISFGTFCLLDKSVVSRMRTLRERNRYFPGLVSFASDQITPISVDRNARAHGSSRVGLVGLAHLAITALVSFSNAPIRMVSLLGLCASLVAVGSGAAIVGVKLFTERAIPGWASLMTATAFASGVQLLCLGIIGEYIARMYEEVKRRPLFLVEKLHDKGLSATKQVA